MKFITIKAACRLGGGEDSPIHAATYYRGVRLGCMRALCTSAPTSPASKRASCARRSRVGLVSHKRPKSLHSTKRKAPQDLRVQKALEGT